MSTLSEITNIACCICGTKDYSRDFRTVKGHLLVKCDKCGLVYLGSPGPSMDFIGDAHEDFGKGEKEKIEYWGFPEMFEKYREVFEHYFRRRLDAIRKEKEDCKTMFDIGCGYGFWMDFCKKQGMETEGIDLSARAVDWAREKLGLKAEVLSLEEFKPMREFDVVVMCDVLEHLIDPEEQLKKVKELLAPGGVVYIQVPNLLGVKLPLGHGYGLPHHIWQFSPESLSHLLKKTGFKVLDVQTGVMGVIGCYERGGPRISEKIIWKLAETFKIGNRLQLVAGKEG